MRAVRKREHSNANATDEAMIHNRISRPTTRDQSKRIAYPEVWGYIRRNQPAGSFDCSHCGQSFQDYEKLRQHEVDCSHDGTNKQL